MVFRKKFRKNKKANKSTRAIAQKALQLAKVDMPELKYNGIGTGTTQDWIISSEDGGSGSNSTMCNIPQGDLSYQREGNRIRLARLHLNFNIIELGGSNVFRIMVIQLKEQASALAPAAVLDGTSTAYCVQSRYTPEYRHKYKVLMDKVFVMGTTHNRPQMVYNFTKKLLGVCDFQDSSSTAWNNNIQVLAWSQNAATSANTAVSIRGGLYYSDA